MKTERLVLLVTPQFKAHMAQLSASNGVSVAEYMRSQFEREPNSEEAQLASVVHELHASVTAARKSLVEGLAEVESALLHVRTARAQRGAQAQALAL